MWAWQVEHLHSFSIFLSEQKNNRHGKVWTFPIKAKRVCGDYKMGGVFYIYRNLDFLEAYKSKILCPFGGKSLKKESQEISKKKSRKHWKYPKKSFKISNKSQIFKRSYDFRDWNFQENLLKSQKS